jgi:ribonuclease J
MRSAPPPPDAPEIDPRVLHFLPLGGSGEIGMNLNLYAFGGKWLMVDLGVTFGQEEMPGIDLIMPDPSFIVERRDQLVGLVLTHAHEDHLGAVPFLWPRLRCPVYATAFAASVLRRKLQDVGLAGRVPITEIPTSGRFSIKPFDIEYLPLTHSILEQQALAIRTPAGTVLHTGDWKFDPAPMLGPVSDEKGLRNLGDQGVLALIGDSTNALKPGESGSEADVRAALTEVIGRYDQRIAVACFASNVARLESVAIAATKHGRNVGLVGRSMWRMYECARENGYLADAPPFLNEYDAGYVPRDKIVLICTGSQGEPRSALARIAADEHPHIVLERGDAALFSSRIIPGNERAIGKLLNGLTRLGVEIVTDEDAPIHVSGHPNRGELTRMYQMVRPRIAIPVHGEQRHMQAHAELALSCQVMHALVPENGMLIRLGPDKPEIVDHVQAGRLALDGERLVPMDGTVIRGRSRILWNGALIATVVVDKRLRLMADPQVTAPGLIDPESESELLAELIEAAAEAVEKLSKKADDDDIKEAVRRAVRRVAKDRIGKKPTTEVMVVRV